MGEFERMSKADAQCEADLVECQVALAAAEARAEEIESRAEWADRLEVEITERPPGGRLPDRDWDDADPIEVLAWWSRETVALADRAEAAEQALRAIRKQAKYLGDTTVALAIMELADAALPEPAPGDE